MHSSIYLLSEVKQKVGDIISRFHISETKTHYTCTVLIEHNTEQLSYTASVILT